jgi:hypothetical protein
MKQKKQICMCGHTIDNHIEQVNGKAIAGECKKCECHYYCQQVNEVEKGCGKEWCDGYCDYTCGEEFPVDDGIPFYVLCPSCQEIYERDIKRIPKGIVSVARLCSECCEEGKMIPMFDDKNGKGHIHNIRKSEGYLLGKKEAQEILNEEREEAFTNFRKDKSNWITFDDEIQKQVYYKIKEWKDKGMKENPDTYFTSSIFRLVGRMLWDIKQEVQEIEKERNKDEIKFLSWILNQNMNLWGKKEIEERLQALKSEDKNGN